jgi:hypothetical protein
MVGLLGPFPLHVIKAGSQAHRWFDTSSGMFKHQTG